MTDNIIERVAKAIFSRDEHFRTLNGDKWEFAAEWQKTKCKAQAIASIEAMREPTEAMYAAGDEIFQDFDGDVDFIRDGTMNTWRAMIDEALGAAPAMPPPAGVETREDL